MVFILLCACIDTNIQFITGLVYLDIRPKKDIRWKIGNESVGRLGGPFGDELIVGSFISKFSAPLIFYYIEYFSKT